jgi:hypothetical protein
MALVAADKIGLTMADDADLVCVNGMCSEAGLRRLLLPGGAAMSALLGLFDLEVTMEAKLPI